MKQFRNFVPLCTCSSVARELVRGVGACIYYGVSCGSIGHLRLELNFEDEFGLDLTFVVSKFLASDTEDVCKTAKNCQKHVASRPLETASRNFEDLP